MQLLLTAVMRSQGKARLPSTTRTLSWHFKAESPQIQCSVLHRAPPTGASVTFCLENANKSSTQPTAGYQKISLTDSVKKSSFRSCSFAHKQDGEKIFAHFSLSPHHVELELLQLMGSQCASAETPKTALLFSVCCRSLLFIQMLSLVLKHKNQNVPQ